MKMVPKAMKTIAFLLSCGFLSSFLLHASVNENKADLTNTLKANIYLAALQDRYYVADLKSPPPLMSNELKVDENTTAELPAILLSQEKNVTSEEVNIAGKVTLKEAVNLSIEMNDRVKQARERISQADQMIREAYADFLPQVSFSSTNMRKEYNGFDIQNYSQNDFATTATYNLFSSGRHKATVDKNKIVKKEQEEKLKGTMQEEIAKIIDAYCSVVYGRIALEVNKKNYDKLVQIYQIVKTKRELGAATMGDESSIASSVSNAKTAMINTESAYNNARDYYEFLVNQSIEKLYPYETGFEIQMGEFDEVFKEIQANNTDINILKSKIQEKEKEIFINRATSRPTVDLTFMNARRYRNDFLQNTSTTPTDGYNNDFLMQFVINYNIYTGGRTESKTARLMSETRDQTHNLDYTLKETKWDSQKLFNSVQTNTKTLQTLKSEIESSEKMANAYWERFRLSSQDLIILLQAQRQVNSAELEKIRSEKTRVIDYFNLLAKQGKLLEYFGY
jgi:outer membrane protein, adhesin transport system